MKKYLLLAPLTFLAFPIGAAPASAETVIVKERRHVDNGLHRGWRHGHRQTGRKVVVQREVGRHGATRVTKRVTHTNAYGDRLTRKVTREVN